MKEETLKKVWLGDFFGKRMYCETTEDDNFDYAKAMTNWVEDTKKQAVREYKDELFFKNMDNHIAKKKNSLWYRIGNKLFQ